jgi:hypothetical protein
MYPDVVSRADCGSNALNLIVYRGGYSFDLDNPVFLHRPAFDMLLGSMGAEA